MNKENSIAAFIDTLGGTGMAEGSDAFLLSADMDSVGGDNGGDCANHTSDACTHIKNGGNCKNHGVCAASDNKKSCENLGPVTGPNN